jgi:hypothetical protein
VCAVSSHSSCSNCSAVASPAIGIQPQQPLLYSVRVLLLPRFLYVRMYSECSQESCL